MEQDLLPDERLGREVAGALPFLLSRKQLKLSGTSFA